MLRERDLPAGSVFAAVRRAPAAAESVDLIQCRACSLGRGIEALLGERFGLTARAQQPCLDVPIERLSRGTGDDFDSYSMNVVRRTSRESSVSVQREGAISTARP